MWVCVSICRKGNGAAGRKEAKETKLLSKKKRIEKEKEKGKTEQRWKSVAKWEDWGKNKKEEKKAMTKQGRSVRKLRAKFI